VGGQGNQKAQRPSHISIIAPGSALRRLAPLTASQIVDGLCAEAEAWAAGRPFDDDVSVLVVAAKG